MRGARLALAFAALSAGLAAPARAALEDQVTAAYLYNFARFIDWSVAGELAPEFQICIAGSTAVSTALAPVAGQQVAGRPVAVRKVEAVDPQCQIVYVARTAIGKAPVAAPAGVLTVSDAPDFIERGGMIELVLREGRLRFRINREAAQAAGLRVPPQLLALAVE